MFVLFLYLLILGILWWCVQGYFLYLLSAARKIRKIKVTELSADKTALNSLDFSIVVPTYNEKDLISQKIANLKALICHSCHVYFVDASDDGTDAVISAEISGMPNYRLIRAKAAGRSIQINEALSLIKGGVVLITDVDAILAPDTLQKLSSFFEDKNIGVVGGYVRPDTKYKTDISFWKIQNRARFLEGASGFSPVVSGACYAFRREIVNEIPKDTWADDIYVPFLSNSKGFRCLYAYDAPIKEIRAPAGFNDFVKVKIRKACDNIRELLRFFPEVSAMPGGWRIIYLTRFTQVILSPFLIALFLVLIFFQSKLTVICSLTFLFLSAIIQKLISGKMTQEKIGIFETIKTYIITEGILLSALLLYPFQKKKFSYEKIGHIEQ